MLLQLLQVTTGQCLAPSCVRARILSDLAPILVAREWCRPAGENGRPVAVLSFVDIKQLLS
jgi:hypothetical protein